MRLLTTRLLAAIGAAASVLFAVGLALDVRAFDGTRGGHEPPYTDYTGTPIWWPVSWSDLFR
jgi:hypothetical protein